jgi:hypothetical protein
VVSINNQQAFDNALFGIRNQGYKQSLTSVKTSCASCAYRGEDGLKCGVGHSIPDELYKVEMEGKHFSNLLSEHPEFQTFFENANWQLLSKIQWAHDNYLNFGYGPGDFEEEMKEIANEFNLNYTKPFKEIS